MSRYLMLLERAERGLASAAFGALAVLVLTDVFSREVLKQGFPLGPKLAIDLMIWGGFLGAALCTSKATHLRIEAAERLWPSAWKPLVGRIEDAVTGVFCAVMAWLSFRYVSTSYELGEVGVVTRIPLWVSQAVIPYAFSSMTLRYLVFVAWPQVKPVPPIGEGR
jgi:TRAP-type C4-dicarboxylate transport system permease small subunit